MYKLEEIKQGIGGFHINDEYIIYTKKSLKGRIKVENHINEIVFLSEQEWINRFCIINNNIQRVQLQCQCER